MRFETLTSRLAGGHPVDWAALAADCGFFDQAHLSREVRDLAGVTPTELLASTVNFVQDGAPAPSSVAPMKLNGAVPIVPYVNPREAIRWLETAFGATATLIVPPEEDQPLAHAEVQVGTGVVMVDDAERTDSPFALPGRWWSTWWSTIQMHYTPWLLVPEPRSSWSSPTRTTGRESSPPVTLTATCGASGRTGRRSVPANQHDRRYRSQDEEQTRQGDVDMDAGR